MDSRSSMSKVTVVRHPLADHSLTMLRHKQTDTEAFRKHAGIVSKILILEATKHLSLTKTRITTPIAPTAGKKLKENVVVVPVLRAGLAMLFALQDFLPAVSVGFIGLERDEQTAQAHEYYRKMPKLYASHLVMVIDPMLATGGSFDNTITMLKEKGAKRITIVSIVSAPQGIEKIRSRHPGVHIFTGAIDDGLNAKKYIVPGLGDFGDRYFGT